jgi:hypothetical protein
MAVHDFRPGLLAFGSASVRALTRYTFLNVGVAQSGGDFQFIGPILAHLLIAPLGCILREGSECGAHNDGAGQDER